MDLAAEAAIPPRREAGAGPWRLALRRFLHNRVALAAVAILGLIVLFVLAAPLWAEHVAGTGPNQEHTLDTVSVDGEKRNVVSVEGEPIGPQWFAAGGEFFLGADSRLGRDEMVRLMYGGRTSLLVGIGSALATTLLAIALALAAGYFGGWLDAVVARALDVIWSLPTLLFGAALGSVLIVGGPQLGPIDLSGGSLWVPIIVISVFTVPYVARPLRGEVLSLRRREFVEAAIAQGARPLRVMFAEILPNLASTIIVLFTLTIANNMLLEAGLSFLGVGVQAPNSSWGTMISVGVELLEVQPLLAILPGTMIALTVLAVNLIGDGLRNALDPRARLRLEAHAGTVEPREAPAR